MRDFFSLERWLPGLAALLQYQRAWLMPDLRAGLSVAAVALPVAIAYAELAGVGAIVGLYSCILPMLVYALFGTSRQLIVGPDAATCAVIAAVVTPLAAGDPTRHWQLVMTMTAMTGFWCLIASRFKLGVLADFLSRPILMGLLNGVAITIMVGQLSKIFGFTFSERYLIERIRQRGHLYHPDPSADPGHESGSPAHPAAGQALQTGMALLHGGHGGDRCAGVGL